MEQVSSHSQLKHSAKKGGGGGGVGVSALS